jgi:hypothetical protein
VNNPDPIPPYFTVGFVLRYILWFCWTKAVSILQTVQAVVAAITLDPTLVSHGTFHWFLIGNSVLCVILAQIDRKSPPPTKGP